MADSKATCVSFLLLPTYIAVLALGIVGLWVTGNNFWIEEPLPPTPPPEEALTTTTTYPRRYYEDRERVPQAYIDYVDNSGCFARFTNDARFYLGPSSLVCVAVSAVLLLPSLCCRKIFTTTLSLYSSLGLWIMVLTFNLLYQDASAYSRCGPYSIDSVYYVMGIQISLLILLVVQILLNMWELRRQSTKVWPTLNCFSVMTPEAVLVAARLTLLVFTIAALSDSQITFGFAGERDSRFDSYYSRPRIPPPLVLSFCCYSAVLYNAVATVETAMSLLFGKIHNCMTGVTSLLSTLSAIVTAVLCSPVIVRIFIGSKTIYPETMYYAVGLSIVTFIHVISCVFLPTFLRSSPNFTKIAERLSNLVDNSVMITTSQRERARISISKMITNPVSAVNCGSAAFSLLSIILSGISLDVPGPSWGIPLVLAVNISVLAKTVSSVISELAFGLKEYVPLKQRLISLCLENVILFVGAISMCVGSYESLGVVTGVLNVLFVIFQCGIAYMAIKGKLQDPSPHEEAPHEEAEGEGEGSDESNTDDKEALVDAMA